ncbi:MAG: ArnT family glycosyltransferase [Anaerolineae bacterium]
MTALSTGRRTAGAVARRRAFPWPTVALSTAILAAVWLSRSLAASTFVTWDEPAWVYRSVRFLTALSEGDLRGTMQVGHPGVLTMWIGALSLLWGQTIGAVSQAQLAAVNAISTLDVHDPGTLTLLVGLLPAAKAGIPLAHGLIAVGIFLLLQRLLGVRYALVGALFLAVDPYYLALSRVLHMDALTAGLMLASVLAALVYVRERARRYLLLSAALAGMAALTKSYGVLVAPFVGLLLLLEAGKGRLPAALCDIALWGGAAILGFALLWPAMWVAPIGTLREVMGLSLSYAADPGDATSSFFLGANTSAPGAAFYPVMLYFRATPLALVGVALAVVGLALRPLHGGANHRRLTWAFLGYGALFLAIITLSEKKYERYMLPANLALDMLAMLGLVGALERLAQALRQRLPQWASGAGSCALACLLVLGSAGALLGRLAPAHYLAYYNPWAGGLAEATEKVPVGWGEGMEQAAAYLADLPDAEDTAVATWSVASIAPTFPGRVLTLTATNLPAADYVLLYVGDIQGRLALAERFCGTQPEFVAKIGGVPYAWLYRNTCADELESALAQVGEGASLVLLDRPSVFDQHYTGELPLVALETADEAGITAQLNAALSRNLVGAGQDVLYVRYDDEDTEEAAGRNDPVARLLQHHGLLLEESRFACGTVSRYWLLAGRIRPLALGQAPEAGFGGQLLLEGYGLSGDAIAYRQTLGVRLVWKVLQPVPEEYHLFVHLLGEKDRKWGQRDVPLCDAEGACAQTWEAGSTHTLDLDVELEPGTVPGAYRLVVGLYRIEDLARLPVLDAGGQRIGDEFLLGPVTVIPSGVPVDASALSIPSPLDARLGEQVQVLGFALPESAHSGADLNLELFWRALGDVDASWDLVVRLAQDGAVRHEGRVQPAGEGYPTEAWSAGDLLHAVHALRLPSELESGLYDVQVNLCDGDGRCLAGDDLALGQVQIQHVDRLFDVPEMQYPSHARLGDIAELLGYDFQGIPQPGSTLRLTLYWRVLETTDVSYTAFTHLLDAGQAVRGQRDSVPADGERPTDGWVPDEIVVDTYEIPLDVNAPLGIYQVEVGLYDPATGERLPVTLSDGTADPNRRVLLPQPLALG